MLAPSSLALRLGYGGLLPFVMGAVLVWLLRADAMRYVALGLAAYGALIVSFLGGIHWGLAMRQTAAAPASASVSASAPAPRLLLWGVVPSLVVWPALMLPAKAGLVIVGAMLFVCYAVDRVLYVEQGVAGWLPLRLRLSTVAALCCLVGAAGS
jgi:Protein of unknown function (DUF3429)